MNKLKVAIVYHYIPHYRKAIFNEMCRDGCGSVEYHIAADEISNIPSIKVLKISDVSSGPYISKKWKKLKNVWITKNILWQRNVLRLSWSKDYDAQIMLGNMYFISTWFALVLARLRGKKVYFWSHGFRDEENGLKGVIRAFFYSLADGLFLYGNRAKDILIKKGFSPDKLHVIYNSLDFEAQTAELNKISTKDMENMKKRLDIGDEAKIIIAIGRITKEKKIDMLIDAISGLNKTGDCYKLIVVGDGPEKTLMERKAHELSVIGDVIFYGECYGESELAILLSMADVSVVPGDIGLSAIHSLTYGTPVVTHNDFTTHKPEFEAIKDGKSGSFYNSGSVADLIEKIRFWSMGDHDEVFHNCRGVISKYYNAEYQKKIIDKVLEEDC